MEGLTLGLPHMILLNSLSTELFLKRAYTWHGGTQKFPLGNKAVHSTIKTWVNLVIFREKHTARLQSQDSVHVKFTGNKSRSWVNYVGFSGEDNEQMQLVWFVRTTDISHGSAFESLLSVTFSMMNTTSSWVPAMQVVPGCWQKPVRFEHRCTRTAFGLNSTCLNTCQNSSSSSSSPIGNRNQNTEGRNIDTREKHTKVEKLRSRCTALKLPQDLFVPTDTNHFSLLLFRWAHTGITFQS